MIGDLGYRLSVELLYGGQQRFADIKMEPRRARQPPEIEARERQSVINAMDILAGGADFRSLVPRSCTNEG